MRRYIYNKLTARTWVYMRTCCLDIRVYSTEILYTVYTAYCMHTPAATLLLSGYYEFTIWDRSVVASFSLIWLGCRQSTVLAPQRSLPLVKLFMCVHACPCHRDTDGSMYVCVWALAYVTVPARRAIRATVVFRTCMWTVLYVVARSHARK